MKLDYYMEEVEDMEDQKAGACSDVCHCSCLVFIYVFESVNGTRFIC